ncbi:MAG: hypothetical protein PWR20_2446 [Bacteroidales bacterium]|nr:hypothetical protein [Bacteroidales bacterium]
MPANSPIVLIDSRISRPIIQRLEAFAEIFLLEPQPGVYEAISAHPDIFFCQIGNLLIHSPTLNPSLIGKLKEKGVALVPGAKVPTAEYPNSVPYNAVTTSKYLIHKPKATDPVILSWARKFNLQFISVKQGYSRCSLLPLNNNHYITSDPGIIQNLEKLGLEIFYYPPHDILLPGFSNGFIGGCAGVWGNTVFFTGTPQNVTTRRQLESFIEKAGMKAEYLSEKILIDAGSLLFL